MVPLLAHIPVIYVTHPGVDWCAVIADALGGDIVMFEPGHYLGACDVVAAPADKKGERTILQSFDPDALAVFSPAGPGAPVFRLAGERLTLLQVVFEGGYADQAYVEVGEIEDLTVRWTEMADSPGAGILQVADAGRIAVENARFTQVAAAIELACPDGGCTADEVLVDDSVITGGTTAIRVGAAPQVRIVDTIAIGAIGTGLDLTAGADGVIEGSYFEAATALRLAGPVRVTNTFFVGAPTAAEILVGPVDWIGVTALGAAHAPKHGLQVRTSAVDQPLPGGTAASGTVVCADPVACWVDPTARDLSPVQNGPLDGAGLPDPDLLVDWCGSPRRPSPTAGALEAGAASPGPITPAYRNDIVCSGGASTATDATGPTTGDTGRAAADAGSGPCGCTTHPSPHFGWWLLPWLARRRRPVWLRDRVSQPVRACRPLRGPVAASRSR